MKVQFNFAETTEHPTKNNVYELSFTLVGFTEIDGTELILASQKSGGMDEIKQQVLAELVALLQLDLYEKVIESGGDIEKEKIQKIQTQERPVGKVDVQSPISATETEAGNSQAGQNP